jgi:hypothetical protein
MLGAKIKTGAFTGTGVALNIEVGFTPKYVKIVNLNDAGALDPPGLEWMAGMADAAALKLVGTTVAYSQLTTLGITPYDGDAGMTALTGTIALTLNSAVLTGTNTKFTTELRAGDVIRSDYDGKTFKVLSITSATSLVADAVAEATVATKAFTRVNGRAEGFTLGADTDVNVDGEAGVWMAIGD